MKTVDDYMSMPWTYNIETEQSDGKCYFIIRVNEFPGVCTDNENLTQGMKEVKEVLRETIEWYLKDGWVIPCPVDKNEFKGKIHYRTDPETHYHIARAAKHKKMSLNKTLDMLVNEGLRQLRL